MQATVFLVLAGPCGTASQHWQQVEPASKGSLKHGDPTIQGSQAHARLTSNTYGHPRVSPTALNNRICRERGVVSERRQRGIVLERERRNHFRVRVAARYASGKGPLGSNACACTSNEHSVRRQLPRSRTKCRRQQAASVQTSPVAPTMRVQNEQRWKTYLTHQRSGCSGTERRPRLRCFES